MNTIITILLTTITLLFLFSAYIYTRILKILGELRAIKNLIAKHDDSMTKKLLVTHQPNLTPAPNEATIIEDESVPLDEQHPWSIPKDVKVEVEGGDTLAPPGFEVSNG
jgi:hypothetical protein